MEIREAQKQSVEILEQINKKTNVTHDATRMMFSLVEEVGEVARELSKEQGNYRGDFNKTHLGEELSEVISRVLVIATDYGIDMQEAFVNKLNKIRVRFELK